MKKLSVKFYLQPSRSKGTRHQIYIRLIYDQKKSEIATEHFLASEDWNEDAQRARKNDRINRDLSAMENRFFEIKSHLVYEEKQVSAAYIKAVFTGKNLPFTDLLTYYEIYLLSVEKDNSFARGTFHTYQKTKSLIKEFLRDKYGNEQLNIRKVDYDFIDNLHQHMCQLPGANGTFLKVNTIGKHHSRFRTFLNYALNRDKIDRNPYQRFSIKFEESERTFLTKEELAKMETGSLGGNLSLDRIRDIFLFSVYTGLRFSDVQSLRMTDFTLGEKGQVFFYHKEQKTGKNAVFPLLGPAESILKKYAQDDARITGNYALPRISNQRCNDYLKIIAVMVGITDKVISHHVARHTCATTILLENDVPLDKVQAWMNHSNIRETMLYAKMTGRAIKASKDVSALTVKLSGRSSYPI